MTNYGQYDLIIANLTDMTEMGLPQATVFQLQRLVTIPWAEEWVGVLGNRGPSISTLNAKYRGYLTYIQGQASGKTNR